MSTLPEVFARAAKVVPELAHVGNPVLVLWHNGGQWKYGDSYLVESVGEHLAESIIIAGCVRWLLKQPGKASKFTRELTLWSGTTGEGLELSSVRIGDCDAHDLGLDTEVLAVEPSLAVSLLLAVEAVHAQKGKP